MVETRTRDGARDKGACAGPGLGSGRGWRRVEEDGAGRGLHSGVLCTDIVEL